MKALMVSLCLALLPAVEANAEVGDGAVIEFFQELGIKPSVNYNVVLRDYFGNTGVENRPQALYEVKVGTPAWVELGLPSEVQPEPWPTPVETTLSPLGREMYTLLSRLSDKQRAVLKARLAAPGARPREIEEIVRLLKSYIIPMRNAKGADGTPHAILYPEDYKEFNRQIDAVLASIPEEEAPQAAARAAAGGAPERTMEDVLRYTRARAQVQQGLLSGRKLLGSMLDGTQNAASTQLAARRAAGANDEEIRRLEGNVQFLSWLNGPKTRQALRGDPEKTRELQQVVAAIDEITKPGADGKTHRQEALYPLVKFVHESQLSQSQWEDLIERFPMGDSINRLGWAKLWRMGIDGRLPDGTPLTAGLIGSGVDERHPLLAGKVSHRDGFTNERVLSPDGIPVPEPRGNHETMVASVVLAALPNARINSYKNMPEESKAPRWRNISSPSQYIATVTNALAAARRDRVAAVNLSQGTAAGIGVPIVDEMQKAVEAAHQDGIPVAVSAGNEGPGTRNLPATVALSVGSLDGKGESSEFSSEEDVIRTLPDGQVRLEPSVAIMAPGEFVMARPDPSGKYDDPAKLYAPNQGTSFSSPWVTASLVALEQVARRHGAEVSVEEKIEILTKTGTRVDVPLHPLGIPSLNPVAAVEELERRLAARAPKAAQGPALARETRGRSAADFLDPAKLVAGLMSGFVR